MFMEVYVIGKYNIHRVAGYDRNNVPSLSKKQKNKHNETSLQNTKGNVLSLQETSFDRMKSGC